MRRRADEPVGRCPPGPRGSRPAASHGARRDAPAAVRRRHRDHLRAGPRPLEVPGPGRGVEVVPNGVDTEFFSPRRRPAAVPDPVDVAFVGNMGYPPNVRRRQDAGRRGHARWCARRRPGRPAAACGGPAVPLGAAPGRPARRGERLGGRHPCRLPPCAG